MRYWQARVERAGAVHVLGVEGDTGRDAIRVLARRIGYAALLGSRIEIGEIIPEGERDPGEPRHHQEEPR